MAVTPHKEHLQAIVLVIQARHELAEQIGVSGGVGSQDEADITSKAAASCRHSMSDRSTARVAVQPASMWVTMQVKVQSIWSRNVITKNKMTCQQGDGKDGSNSIEVLDTASADW
ncbi:hypothetical protein CHU98_g10148 [Xylaria longipes]|nr:hypothetical protein CHU98_g10148 [Xylaria longipes]